MSYSPALEIPATYEAGTEQTTAGETKEVQVDVSSALQTRIAAAGLSANNAPVANGNLELLPSSRVSVMAPSLKAAITATQTIKQGYKTYQPINESDWWWWYIAIDIPDALLNNGEILYQYVSVTDPATTKTFTVGCSIKIGSANSYAIDYYKHTDGQPDQLISTSSEVTGKTWLTQAPDLKEEADDIKWKAGTTHVPSTAPASNTPGNTNQACYFYEELPKIGRNPNDFDKNLNLKFGTRIYKDDSATTFDAVPESTVTIKKEALAVPNYQA